MRKCIRHRKPGRNMEVVAIFRGVIERDHCIFGNVELKVLRLKFGTTYARSQTTRMEHKTCSENIQLKNKPNTCRQLKNK